MASPKRKARPGGAWRFITDEAQPDLKNQGWHKVADTTTRNIQGALNSLRDQGLPSGSVEEILRSAVERAGLLLEGDQSEWIIRDPKWRPPSPVHQSLF